jgi:plasmid stabilization system protein ParE
MRFLFHPDAEGEFFKAIDYYETCEQGLGYDFSIEVYTAIQKIIAYPKIWPVFKDDIRRYLINRFPYGILYSLEDNEILILAIMHLHRKPEYWKFRYKG